LPEQATGELAISQLQLLWNTPQTPWQGTASVYYSEDLKRWYTLREDMPLLDVAAARIALSSIGSIPIRFYLPRRIAISWWC
jgi:uncharacterized protein YbaR (Trm112 family)